LRPVGENKSELYRSILRKQERHIYDLFYGGEKEVEHITFTIEPELLGWVRLEGRKVYWLGNNYHYGSPDKEFLFYDFSLNVGDTFGIAPQVDWHPPGQEERYKFYLSSIDNVLIGNEYRKKYNFVHIWAHFGGPNNWTNYNFSVIEGIGCDRYFFYVFNTDYSHNKPLLRVYYKNKPIWKNPIFYHEGE
jgi:hypothetical protein